MSQNRAGRAYLVSGATGAPLLELVSPTPSRTGGFGFAVSGLNDLDGDGAGELAVGAALETTGPGLDQAGRVGCFFRR